MQGTACSKKRVFRVGLQGPHDRGHGELGDDGLQYLRARYYDPETGTFPSREPLALDPGSLGHALVYADSNTIRFSDPTTCCRN